MDYGHATYGLIGTSALLFAALFFYYERATLILRRKAGVPGIRLNPIEETVLKKGKKGEFLLWGGILFLLSALSIVLSILVFFH